MSVANHKKLEAAFQKKYGKPPLDRPAEEEGHAKHSNIQDVSKDVEDSNVEHGNVTQVSVEEEREVANILGEMQKLAEESQAKLDGLAAENLLIFAERCNMAALQTARENNNDLNEVKDASANSVVGGENESIQPSDQEHQTHQPDEKLRFQNTLSTSSLPTICIMLG